MREDEIKGAFEHLGPAVDGQHDRQAGPDVVKCNDEGAEGEAHEGDGEDAGVAQFAQADEEIDPGAGLRHVRQADHQKADSGEEFGGFFHGTASQE